jgi:phosphohistidine swiveling domain-containing protein
LYSVTKNNDELVNFDGNILDEVTIEDKSLMEKIKRIAALVSKDMLLTSTKIQPVIQKEKRPNTKSIYSHYNEKSQPS